MLNVTILEKMQEKQYSILNVFKICKRIHENILKFVGPDRNTRARALSRALALLT